MFDFPQVSTSTFSSKLSSCFSRRDWSALDTPILSILESLERDELALVLFFPHLPLQEVHERGASDCSLSFPRAISDQ